VRIVAARFGRSIGVVCRAKPMPLRLNAHLEARADRMRANRDQIRMGQPTREGDPPIPHRNGPVRIVIADDDSLSRRLIQRTLERAGYDVVAVENGCLAAERLSSTGAPRLALLDWEMPGLDGPRVCRAIRSRTDQPYTYIILLTAKESKDDLIAGLEAGADDYLTKPCHAEELKARLRTGQRILDLQDRLFYDARHDSLTRLPNRAYFLDRLIGCVNHAREDKDYRFAILFVDLDRFKTINDSLGHLAGDELLTQFAERLLRSIRRDDTVSRSPGSKAFFRTLPEDILARLGGDEFTVLLDGIRDGSDATRIAERIQNDLNLSFLIAGRALQITASIGISISGAGCSNAEDMLRGADAAMYRSKTTGRFAVSGEISPSWRESPERPTLPNAASGPISSEWDFPSLLKVS
jgi:two-component system cell cycle response regulator